MFVGGADRLDVKQGILGDCWLLAAMASLCSDKILLSQVIPANQEWSEGLVSHLTSTTLIAQMLTTTVMLGFSTFVFGISVPGLKCVLTIGCQHTIIN